MAGAERDLQQERTRHWQGGGGLARIAKVILVGADNWAVEVIPGEEESIAFPVHQTLITDNGIHIVENVRTDLIAAEAAKTGRGTFFLNMTVPKAVGLTGTFVNIEAIQ
jgi:hypothetical protein